MSNGLSDVVFDEMPDHRQPSNITYPLPTIIGTTIAAVICGAEDWYDVQDYGIEKKAWLGRFPDVHNGTPPTTPLIWFFQLADEGFRIVL